MQYRLYIVVVHVLMICDLWGMKMFHIYIFATKPHPCYAYLQSTGSDVYFPLILSVYILPHKRLCYCILTQLMIT